MTRHWTYLVLVPLALGAPRELSAQQPSRSDSLEVVLRRLMARVDSLERVIRQLQHRGRDTTAAVDELAALRAAAQAAGGTPDSTPPAATARSEGARSLSSLNPEISVTGDARLQSNLDLPFEENFAIREFEFSFQSALDPYASTKVFLTYEEGRLDLEEGYLYWPDLPGHIRLDLGRLRQQVGELNRWHLHALPETEYPLAYQEYFGEEGLIGDGARLSMLLPIGGLVGVQEVTLEGTVGANTVLFDDGNRPAVLAHLNNFLALSPATFIQVGGTAVYGENPDLGLRTTVFGGDFRFTWRPPSQALYRSFTVRGEALHVRKQFDGIGAGSTGGYVGTEYQLDRRWFAGVRGDYVEPVGGGTAVWAIVPHLTWWQSEWAYIRAQWQHRELPVIGGGRTGDNQLQVQVVWSVGPHKHETY